MDIIEKIIEQCKNVAQSSSKNETVQSQFDFYFKKFYIHKDELIVKIGHDFDLKRKNALSVTTVMKGDFFFRKNFKTNEERFEATDEEFYKFPRFQANSLFKNSENRKEYKKIILKLFLDSDKKICLEKLEMLIKNPKQSFRNYPPMITYYDDLNAFKIHFKFDFTKESICHKVHYRLQVNVIETEQELKITDIRLEDFNFSSYVSINSIIPDLEIVKKVFLSNLLLRKVFKRKQLID